jgi:hypothetical protein
MMAKTQCINNSDERGHSGVERISHGTRDYRGKISEVQQVNSMPLLLSCNQFVCLQVDILMQPKIYNIESKEVVDTISHLPIPN